MQSKRFSLSSNFTRNFNVAMIYPVKGGPYVLLQTQECYFSLSLSLCKSNPHHSLISRPGRL